MQPLCFHQIRRSFHLHFLPMIARDEMSRLDFGERRLGLVALFRRPHTARVEVASDREIRRGGDGAFDGHQALGLDIQFWNRAEESDGVGMEWIVKYVI